MLKNMVELTYKIERYMVDAKVKAINVEIATGSLIDGEFIPDRRSLIKHSIVNIPDRPEQEVAGVIIPALIGRAWFDEAASFKQTDSPDHIGMTDYQYNSNRLWTILLEMGLVSGAII